MSVACGIVARYFSMAWRNTTEWHRVVMMEPLCLSPSGNMLGIRPLREMIVRKRVRRDIAGLPYRLSAGGKRQAVETDPWSSRPLIGEPMVTGNHCAYIVLPHSACARVGITLARVLRP
jgi:hypothetical protein